MTRALPLRPVRSRLWPCLPLLLGFAAQAASAARGVSPYLPQDISPEIERQIERIMVLAGKPVMTRPLAAATVLDATDIACDADPAACAAVRRFLRGFMKDYGLSFASLELATTDSEATALPNRHGADSASHYEAAAQIFWQPSDWLLVGAGFHASSNASTPTGTLLSLGNEYLQFDAGFRDRWLSPMTMNSMLLGTQAETMPSVGISNYRPLTRFGLRYDFFISEMSYSDQIRFGEGFTAGNPQIAGLHLSIEPLPGWSIGVNRILQYGGGERSDDFGDLIDAFFRPNEFDNTTSTDANQQFGNQVASITARYIHDGARPFSVYFEYSGEDTSARNNLRLGNVGFSAGIHLPALLPRLDLTVEFSEWQNAWYVSGVYGDGLRHEGNVIGHWGADWRMTGDGIGAQALMLQTAWLLNSGGSIETTYYWLDNEDYSPVDYERADLLSIRYSRPWGELQGGVGIEIGDDSLGTNISRLSVFMRY